MIIMRIIIKKIIMRVIKILTPENLMIKTTVIHKEIINQAEVDTWVLIQIIILIQIQEVAINLIHIITIIIIIITILVVVDHGGIKNKWDLMDHLRAMVREEEEVKEI